MMKKPLFFLSFLSMFSARVFTQSPFYEIQEKKYYDLTGPVFTVAQHVYQYKPVKKGSKKRIKILDLTGSFDGDDSLVFSEYGFLLASFNMREQVDPVFGTAIILKSSINCTYDSSQRLINFLATGDGHNSGRYEDSLFYNSDDKIVERHTYFNHKPNSKDYWIYNKNGEIKSVEYFQLGERSRRLVYEYSSLGKRIIDSTGNGSNLFTNVRVFNASGNITHDTSYNHASKNSQIRTYTYDETELLIRETYRQFFEDSVTAMPEVISYVYDSLGRQISLEEMKDGGTCSKRIISKYNEKGMISEVQEFRISVGDTLALYAQKKYSYNEQNKLITEERYFTNLNNPIAHFYHYTYDSYGNWIVKNLYASDGSLTTVVERKITYY